MFGYELADILLFDFETLIESYAGYLSNFKWVFYSGLAINLLLIYFIKKNLRVALAFVGMAWMLPGYFFFIRQFESIYWPSAYFGYVAIAMGLALICMALTGGPKRQSISPESTRRLPLTTMQIMFAAATLTPAFVSYFLNPRTVMSFGTSATVAALATMSLCMFQKRWLARIVSLIALLWCLLVASSLWALVYKV